MRADGGVRDGAIWGQCEGRADIVHVATKSSRRMQWFHPDLAAAYAGQLAASDRLACYERAIDVCDEALGVADGSTHPGWARQRSRCNQLAGRQQRLVVRPSGMRLGPGPRRPQDGYRRSRVPITGLVHRPVSPRADTGPFVGRFSAHIATELVTVGPVSRRRASRLRTFEARLHGEIN